jgi:hypothetical protein
MSFSSCSELDALVARVGLDEAKRLIRGWIGARDAEAFLAWERQRPAPEPVGLLATASDGGAGAGDGAGGGAGLCATASGDAGLLSTVEKLLRLTDPAGGGGAGLAVASSAPAGPRVEDRAERGATSTPRVEDCELHGPMQGGGLWYAPNSFGYSTFSPPCNGCADGQKDAAAGLWMSGFGRPAPLRREDPPPEEGLVPTSSAWYSGGEVADGGGLAATSSAPVQSEAYKQFCRLQTVMLECLQEAEAEPTALWRLDNLLNAMERFRAAGGGDGDNYKHCLERYEALSKRR